MINTIDLAPIVLAYGGIVMVFAAYTQGRVRGYKEGKALNEPLVAALGNQVKSYGELNDALNRQVAAQKDQIEAQDRLIVVLGGESR